MALAVLHDLLADGLQADALGPLVDALEIAALLAIELGERADRLDPRGYVALKQRCAVRLAPAEEGRIVDQPVFDHLGISGAQLADGQGIERARVDQHI